MTMTRLNMHEAKTHLSRYLAELDEQEVIILCNRNVPVAEIRLLPKPSKQNGSPCETIALRRSVSCDTVVGTPLRRQPPPRQPT